MAVRCERVGQAKLAHDHTARAVGEGEIFVTVLEEHLARLLEAVAVDALPPEARAPIDLLPPFPGSDQPEPEPKESERFMDDEVGRDQHLAGLERSITRRTTSSVRRIRRVGARQPAGGGSSTRERRLAVSVVGHDAVTAGVALVWFYRKLGSSERSRKGEARLLDRQRAGMPGLRLAGAGLQVQHARHWRVASFPAG